MADIELPKIEKLKTAIRPGMAIWGMCLLTASWWFDRPLHAAIFSICVAAIGQWIPDRAVKRIKEAWKV